jgi:protein TonB
VTAPDEPRAAHGNALTKRTNFYVLEVIAQPSREPTMSKFSAPVAPLACAIALTLGLGLAGCNSDEKPAASDTAAAPADAAAGPSAAEKALEAAAAQQAAALAALPPEELKKRGSQALREQRLYAPAGDNAMEYYLALRKRSEKPDPSAESALMDLQPYAVIAAEQAVGREDWVEAERLRNLIETADPNAPALPRLASAITDGKANAEKRAADAQLLAEQQAKAAEDAKKRAEELARQTEAAERAAAAAPPPAAATPTPAPARPTPAPATAAPATTAAAPPPTPAPAPARAASSALVAVSTPQPQYPQDALRRGTTGEVVLEFTVNTDGTVGNVTVVNATPRGVFERGVQNTVRRWRFQPVASPQTVRRTFTFAN